MAKSGPPHHAAHVRRARERRLTERVAELGLDQTLRFKGHDYEGRALHVHHRTADHLVVRVSGGSCWRSVGEREYVPARFEVYAIVGGAGNRLVVEEIVHFDITSKGTDEYPDARRRFGKRFP